MIKVSRPGTPTHRPYQFHIHYTTVNLAPYGPPLDRICEAKEFDEQTFKNIYLARFPDIFKVSVQQRPLRPLIHFCPKTEISLQTGTKQPSCHFLF